jgi:O-methyltransferase
MTLEIAKRYPSIRRACLDLPTAELGAIGTFRDSRLEDRCDFVGGDFFYDVPAGADAYLRQSCTIGAMSGACRSSAIVIARTADTGRVLVVDIVEVSLDRIHQQLLFRSALFMQGGSRLLGVKLPENALPVDLRRSER